VGWVRNNSRVYVKKKSRVISFHDVLFELAVEVERLAYEFGTIVYPMNGRHGNKGDREELRRGKKRDLAKPQGRIRIVPRVAVVMLNIYWERNLQWDLRCMCML
jgi:RNase P/RNase MRP subunit p30